MLTLQLQKYRFIILTFFLIGTIFLPFKGEIVLLIRALIIILCCLYGFYIAFQSQKLVKLSSLLAYFFITAIIIASFGKIYGDSGGLGGIILDSTTDYYYFSILTWTTSGYGDLWPLTPEMRIITGIESFFGFVFFGILVTIIHGTINNINLIKNYNNEVHMENQVNQQLEQNRESANRILIEKILDISDRKLIIPALLPVALTLFFYILSKSPKYVYERLTTVVVILFGFAVYMLILFTNFKRLMYFVIYFAINIIIVLSFGFVYQIERGISPTPITEDNTPATKFDKNLDSYYFSLVTWTTLGCGDYRPSNKKMRIVACSQAFLGYIYLSLLIIFIQLTFKYNKEIGQNFWENYT